MTRLASDTAIRERGLKVLNKYMGETDAVRFLSQISAEKKDYLKTQQKLFQGMSVVEIYNRAVAHCAEEQSDYKGKR